MLPQDSELITQFFTFNIEPLEGDWKDSPSDSRIADTVIEMLVHFFSNMTNAIIYLCDSIDDRQLARKRKFDMWFGKADTNEIEKHDFISKTSDYELLNALLIHKNNPEKLVVLEMIKELNENGFMPL